jgi:hypothetical protein
MASLEPVQVNQAPLAVKSSSFEGLLAVRMSDFHGPSGSGKQDAPPRPDSEFSGTSDTWSISFQGRFLQELSADEVVSSTRVGRW